MKHRFGFYRSLIVAAMCALVFTGCPQPVDDTTPEDYDGDGLTNTQEVTTYRTNPRLADTDGDGYEDGEEVGTYQFNPDINPHKFNPRIADVPKIGITLSSLPAIVVHYTTTEGASHTEQNSWGSETASSRSRDRTTSQTKSASHTVGIKMGAEYEFGTSGSKAKVSAELSYSYTSTSSNSTSFSVGQTESKRSTYNNCRSYEQSHNYSEANGEVQTVVEISNIGDIAFTVKNLYLKATEFDPNVPDSLAPICGLNRDTGASTFQSFSLAPGASSEVHYAGDMDLGTTHKLLRDTQNLVIDVETYELVDAYGRPYVHDTTEIGTKTASIVIDYGPGLTDTSGNPRVPGKYLVATNFVEGDPGVSLAEAVTDILQLTYEIGTVSCNAADYRNLKSFDGVVADGALTGETAGYWILIHSYTRGGVEDTDWYTPDMNYTLSDIDVQAGDNILIFHTEDKDGDGLTARQELSWGTDDDNTDTDGDGTDDYTEATDGDSSTHPAVAGSVSDDSVDRASLPDGVTLFEHADFAGDYRTFTPAGDGNIADLSAETLDSGTNADNLISSVVVKGDFQVALYDQPHFRGRKLILTADDGFLPDSNYNDVASSLKVVPGDNTAGLTFTQLAVITSPGNNGFEEFEDLAIGDVVDTGGSGYRELVVADAADVLYVYQYNGAGGMTNPKSFDTSVVLGTGFDRWWDGSDHAYGDRIACGDFADATGTVKDVDGTYLGDYKDEILLTDFEGDHLYIFDPRSTASNKVLQDHEYHTSEGHAVAAGNLDGTYPGWEFAVSHRDDYLRIRYGDNAIAHPDRLQTYDGSGDQMTVGDLDGDGTAEVIYLLHEADTYVGEFRIIDPETGMAVATYGPSIDIMPWDSIAAADVNGDGVDEIIWGADANGHAPGIYVIAWDGTEGSGGFSELGNVGGAVFNSGDRVVAGDLDGDGVAEICHGRNAEDSDGNIVVYTTE